MPPVTKESEIQIACNEYLNYLANTYAAREQAAGGMAGGLLSGLGSIAGGFLAGG